MGGKVSHNWTVERWENAKVDSVIAECSNLFVAIAAFDETCRQYPNRSILLRQGIKVLREQKGTGISPDGDTGNPAISESAQVRITAVTPKFRDEIMALKARV